MDINMQGDPGTGNTFTEIHINNVETFAPNATTVVNNHYGDDKKLRVSSDVTLQGAESVQRKAEIMQYVSSLKQYVTPEWSNRYEATWQAILRLPEVSYVVCEPGKQKDTTFNRNLVANIIYIMCEKGIIVETNATTLAKALEGDKDHPVRAQLRTKPEDSLIVEKIQSLIR
ncbi:hypothetical protein [Phocaeicola sp.]